MRDYRDNMHIACHISVITNNLNHIRKALEKSVAGDDEYSLLDNMIEDIHLRLEEIEYMLGVWEQDDRPLCSCKDPETTQAWYQFDRSQPSDYKMD